MISHASMKRWLVPVMAPCAAVGVALGSMAESFTPCLAALVLSLVAACLLRCRARMAAVWAMTVCAGLCAGQLAYHPALPDEGTYIVSGIVSEEIRSDGTRRITALRSVTLNGQRFSSGAYWSFYAGELPEGLVPGVRATFTARVYHPQSADNPDGFDFRSYLLGRGVTLGIYGIDRLECEDAGLHPFALLARIRHALTVRLERVMGAEAGGYAAATLLGVRGLVPEEDTAAFRRLGIAHILSVSGYHVGVLYALVTGLLGLLGVPAKRRLLPLTAVTLLYAALTGFHAPVVRAAMLLVLGEYGVLIGRQRLGLHMLAASAVVILLLSPAQLTSASFQLTYGALLGLTLVAPRLDRLLQNVLPRQSLRRSVSYALAAQLGVLLPQLYWFHELPLLGVVFNLALMAVFSGLLGLYWMVAALMFLPVAGDWIGRLAALLTAFISRAVRLAGDIPSLVLWTRQADLLTALGWLLLLAGLCCLWRRFGRKQAALAVGGAVLLALSLVPRPFGGTRYIQFSVANADAALLLDGGQAIAVDAGEDGRTLSTYLHQRRMGLDALILTHLHMDHAGGLRALMDDNIPIRVCYLPQGAESAQVNESVLLLLRELEARGTLLVPLTRGDTLALPNGSVTVLWPEDGRVRPNQDANYSSLCLLVELRGTSLLLTGDLDGPYERYVARPADVLKIAHHGSASSTSREFFAAVDPQCALVSCEDGERLLRVRQLAENAAVYGSCECGAITLDFTDAGYRVTPYHPSAVK